MYFRPPEQNTNLARVGILNDDISQLMKNEQKVELKLGIEEAAATLGSIPDEISFTHNFQFKDNCYEKQEESIFFIESIGELRLGGHMKRECCKCPNLSCFVCPNCSCADCCAFCRLLPCCNCKYRNCNCCNCNCCNCNCCPKFEALHYYHIPSYILQNDKIRFENFSNYAKLYILDTLIFEFYFSPRNFSDSSCGSCKSNIPHICFTNPLHTKNEKIYFEPLGNRCPTNPGFCYCCFICSCVGIGELERTIVANVGENGSAEIIASRSKKNAWLSQCGCQDNCCHFIDYPDFKIKFINLSNLQKLGLIMSAISYTIFGRWEKYDYRGLFNMNKSYYDF